MAQKNSPNEGDHPDDEPNDDSTDVVVPVELGTPTTIEIPPGTTSVTINIDPSLQQLPPPSAGFLSGFAKSCGCVVAVVAVAILVLIMIGSLGGR